MTDFRIDTTYPRNVKVRKLRRRLGAQGVVSHIFLFAYATEARPSGRLVGMSVEDIEIAAEWPGEAGALVRVLVDLRLLDVDDGTYVIHDWQEFNRWVTESPGRKANAVKQNHIRHHVNKGIVQPACDLCRPSDTSVTDSVTDSASDKGDASTEGKISVTESTSPILSFPSESVSSGKPLNRSAQDVRDVEQSYPDTYSHDKPEASRIAMWISKYGKALVVDVIQHYPHNNANYHQQVLDSKLSEQKSPARSSRKGAALDAFFGTP
jgi:hypothetical protein